MAGGTQTFNPLAFGYISKNRRYVFEVSYPGKAPFLVGNFLADRDEADPERFAVEMTTRFWREHMPDGVMPPVVVKIIPGELRFVPDDREWRRG